MEIFHIIEKDSGLGDKVRVFCENMFDYGDLCVFNSGTLDESNDHSTFLIFKSVITEFTNKLHLFILDISY